MNIKNSDLYSFLKFLLKNRVLESISDLKLSSKIVQYMHDLEDTEIDALLSSYGFEKINNESNETIIEENEKLIDTDLHVAVRDGDYEKLLHILDNNLININQKNESFETAIEIAIKEEKKDFIKILLEHNAKVDLSDVEKVQYITKLLFRFKMKSIVDAVIFDNIQALEFFIANGSDINYKNHNNNSLHTIAACYGSAKTMSYLENKIDTVLLNPVNKISLSKTQSIEIYDINKDVVTTELGVKIEYTPVPDSAISWNNLDLLRVKLKTKKIELFNEYNGKYGIYFFNNSNESSLVLDLKIQSKNVSLVKFFEYQHSKIFLFEDKPGINLSDWEKEKSLIQDILGVPVVIELYDVANPVFDRNICSDRSIMIKEDNISILPVALKLPGAYFKTSQNDSGITEYYFENISEDGYTLWKESIFNISKFMGNIMEIQNYISASKILILRDSTETNLPTLLGVEDDEGNKPSLIYSKNISGNRYFYYSYLPSVPYKKWENRIKMISLKSLFDKPDAVYTLIDCYKSHPDFDKNIDATQAILIKEQLPIPTFKPMKDATFLQDNELFWGYGAGSYEYYTPINNTTHMMVIGGTGSGKSTFMNGIILSLIHNLDKVGKLYLIDLKSGVEFNKYKKLNPEKVTVFSRGTKPTTLLKSIREVQAQMRLREEYLANIDGMEKLTEEPIFIIIDEFAQIELMPTDSSEERNALKEIMKALTNIGSLSRAANIKMFIQTQDPSAVPTEIKKHLISRVLLKTTATNDARATLQNPDQMEVMGLSHVTFNKGRFVFEDDNGGNTILTQLQFPYLVNEDGETANIEYFDKYVQNSFELDESKLFNKMKKHIPAVIEGFSYLADTEILRDNNLDIKVQADDTLENNEDKKTLINKNDLKLASKYGLSLEDLYNDDEF